MAELERVHVSAGPVPICAALERDGACIVEDAVKVDHLAGMNQDLDDLIASATPDERTPAHPAMIDFYGTRTTATCRPGSRSCWAGGRSAGWASPTSATR